MYILKSGLIVCVHGKISIQSTCSLCTEYWTNLFEAWNNWKIAMFEHRNSDSNEDKIYHGKCPVHSNFLYVIHNLKRMTAQPKLFSMLQTFFLRIFFLFFLCSFSSYFSTTSTHTYVGPAKGPQDTRTRGRKAHINRSSSNTKWFFPFMFT